jgi:hypothetical protein
MHVRYESTTAASPDAVVATLTDVSAHRPEFWPNLDPAKYQVHELGETSALVTEGTKSPDVWARERYDWSVPGRVAWHAEESNFCAPGSGIVALVSPGPSGGSRVVIDWERKPRGARGRLAALAVRIGKDRVLGYKAALDRLDRASEEAPPRAA